MPHFFFFFKVILLPLLPVPPWLCGASVAFPFLFGTVNLKGVTRSVSRGSRDFMRWDRKRTASVSWVGTLDLPLPSACSTHAPTAATCQQQPREPATPTPLQQPRASNTHVHLQHPRTPPTSPTQLYFTHALAAPTCACRTHLRVPNLASAVPTKCAREDTSPPELGGGGLAAFLG